MFFRNSNNDVAGKLKSKIIIPVLSGIFFTLEPSQQKDADENSLSCEEKCFPDCMTNELTECVEACQRFCPAI